MEKKTIVIVGGGYAGIIAANRLARKNSSLRIILVTANDFFLEKIRNHQEIAGTKSKSYPIRNLLHKKVELKIGVVDRILPSEKRIRFLDNESLSYDFLGYTVGMKPAQIEEMPETILSVANADDCKRINSALLQSPFRKITVVGGGLTGIETASELAEGFPHAKITLLESGTIGKNFNSEAIEYMLRILKRLGVTVLQNKRAANISVDSILTEDGDKIPHDYCLLSAGLVASDLGKNSGLKVNSIDQIIVDGTFQCGNHPSILGAGDCIKIMEKEYSSLRMSCATALPMGIYLAERISYLTGNPSKMGQNPFSMGYVIRCVSLGRNAGLIQTVNREDAPSGRIWTGRIGAVIKELICKFTILSIKAEKYLDFYAWPSARKIEIVDTGKMATER
ncbi:pyridine nucleotide-disulfide oxidoreductase [Leptospira inadai serovar Lyme str. 10]|uniref:Pyridine nucleotide-disulfide oxidoreductase n=2 Tax=Leptospira inadai serovar Lyme TaxID=293084 RepID=V6HBW1_9LEPT|nr:FAD-dependent oxidoreductase [Leptospira inadai]EQA36987.1 pyridine nucleotide-disulfide oxidoreductase [Leptospira inadai serovar Lyme str. 10]PNV74493.1 NADH dehydrogenase FAD-containing subunit [Leptospira inadai serovar Lyme]